MGNEARDGCFPQAACGIYQALVIQHWSAQGEKISGDQKSEECRNMGEHRVKKEAVCLGIRTSEFTCFCLSWCPTQTKVMRHT